MYKINLCINLDLRLKEINYKKVFHYKSTLQYKKGMCSILFGEGMLHIYYSN